MIRHKLLRFLAAGLLGAMVSACATAPIVEQYRQEARSHNVSFSTVLKNPDAYINGIVIWGGSIIETINHQNSTEIIVLQEPLGSLERPEKAESSLGRFIAISPKFLDPVIYRKGRKVTLAGQVTGKRTLRLGETSYTYPVVTIKQLHLWKKRQIRYYAYPYDYWYDGWGPWWRPYGWWYPGYYDWDFDEDYE